MPARKAASLLKVAVRQTDPYPVLEAALRTHLVGALGGDPYRDIDSIEVLRDPDGQLYWGKWRGHLRLTVGVMIDHASTAEVMLIATKGARVADDLCLGKTGSDVGNSILVARLLHVALFALRSTGVVAVRNEPYDARVRRKYEDMGFAHGEHLPLDDAAALTKAFAFIEQMYQHESVAGRLSLATPPLPL
ncbi:MAG TPA: hypothetical protein VNO30_13430 [Kofleriaceae bacterium]|nr:hypothetical protein [Kofleriaceae bacterium]